jgi:hypothetical protein
MKEKKNEDPHIPSPHVIKPGSPNYTHWCLDVSHNNIYNIGSKLNCKDNSEAFSMSFLLAIMFTILVEYVTHQIEKRVEGNKIYLTILNKVYKELMMMGLMGLLINVVESLNIFEGLFKMASLISDALGFPHVSTEETDHERIERRVLIFDFVHVSLFFLSIFYILIVILTFTLCRITWNRWSSYEEATYEQVLERSQVLKERIRKKNKFLLLFDWILLYKYYSNSRRLCYYSIKQRFLRMHKLDPCFRFHTYLRQSLLHIFIKLIELDWKLMGVVWLGFLANYIRNKVINLETAGGGVPLFFLAFGGISLLLSFVMFIGCRVGLRAYISKYCCMSNNTASLEYDTKEKTEITGLLHHEPIKNIQEACDELTVDSTLDPDNKPVNMRRYFPFFSPAASFICLQICLLVQSFYLAMIMIHFAYVIVIEDGISENVLMRWLILLCVLTPSFVICFALFPLTIPDFTILYSVESKTQVTCVKEEKEERDELTSLPTHDHFDIRGH